VDRALDSLIAWVVAMARRLGRYVAQAGVPQDPAERLRLGANAAVAAAERMSGRVTEPLLRPVLAGLRVRYGLTSLEPFVQGGVWWVNAVINPNVTKASKAKAGEAKPSARDILSPETRAEAVRLLNAITTPEQVGPALVELARLEPAILARYKGSDDGYLLYLGGRSDGMDFEMPLPYLKRRASFKKGKAIEAYWINKVLGVGKNGVMFKVFVDNEWGNFIPDILTPTIVGDAKDWKEISFTPQLRAFNLIAKAANNPGRVKDAADKPVTTNRTFVLIVRGEAHTEKETKVSGPLKGAALVYYAISDKDVI